MLRIFVALCFVFAVLACSTQEKKAAEERTRLTGSVRVPQKGGLITLEEIKENSTVVIDTIYLLDDSTFTLDVRHTEPGFYRLNFYNKQFVNLILNKESVHVKVDGNNPTGMAEVSGSRDTDYFMEVNRIMQDFQNEAKSLQNEYIKAKNSKKEEKAAQIEAEYMKLQAQNSEKVKAKIREMGVSLAALYAVNYLNQEDEFPFLDSLAGRFEKELPQSRYSRQFVDQIKSVRAIAIGQPAPDFSLPNPEGEMISLSSYRGKYVMIDFWAAWCRPCRMENPNVVKMYNKYKDQGFEVLGVSLDRNREDWLKAIEKDGLIWSQVIDNSEASQLYQINAIPATYLIDKEGKIIGKNLRGQALEEKLQEIFGRI
jgi:peroxiredoxin